MKYLLSKAIIIDATSVHHKQQVDLLIVDGTIIEIGNIDAKADYTTIDLEGFYIAPGFVIYLPAFQIPVMSTEKILKVAPLLLPMVVLQLSVQVPKPILLYNLKHK